LLFDPEIKYPPVRCLPDGMGSFAVRFLRECPFPDQIAFRIDFHEINEIARIRLFISARIYPPDIFST
jgi:hypothetical protein